MRQSLSFVYPCFNRANLFLRTLESFREQEGRQTTPFEILVIDDGSTDQLSDICRAFPELPLQYIRINTDRHRGPIYRFGGANNPSAALNVGIRSSRGDWVILSSPEVYHVHKTNLIRLSEWQTNYWEALICNVVDPSLGLLSGGSDRRYLHFLARYSRLRLIQIGGFDERFLAGWGYEDTEFVERWLASGGRFVVTDGEIEGLHQPHPRVEQQTLEGVQRARRIFAEVRGQTAVPAENWGGDYLIESRWQSPSYPSSF